MATTKAYELGQLGGTISVNADDIITFPENSKIGDGSIAKSDLVIAPEVLEIQVQAPAAGQDTDWQWTWEQSTLPYARRTITNSPELNVPLYKEGTYTINNFAKTQFGSMTQTHSLFLKWIDGAGSQNLVSWSTDQGTFTDSHPDINSGNDTTVQRLSISVPSTVTPPTLTAPSVTYSVSFVTAGAYTFSGPRAGDNPNIGPFRRGGTYTFNVNASGHPFYFTTDNGTNFSAGTYFGEYTSGVTGSRTDSGTVTIVVPANAPDTLYYQCGNHSAMRGAITVKDLEVETNIDGNYVIYAQHGQEGHKTPVELRPIPSLVNQMCLVYDATSGKFVPQDLATYVENTPSFENKIREVAGTAELVVEDGSAVIAKVNVYDDSTYLPLTGNNAGDQAFATDTDILYIWDGSAWQQAGAANTDDLTEGTTNLFYTDARADARIAAADTGDLTEGSNLYYTDARARAAISGTGSLSYNSSSGVMSFTQGNTDTITEGSTNLFYTDARADTRAQLKVDALVDAAPNTLDTLNELAAALGDDPNFATTTATNIGNKANKTLTVSAGGGLTGGGDLTANRTISHADTSTVSDVNGSGNTFIQDIGFDTYGHVTSVGTGTVTVGDGAMTVTAGSGLAGGGQLGTANQSGASSVTVSHADTSSQASVNNSSGTVIQDITLDTYGHITGIASANLDDRYYTESEADSRFVNQTGDTMTGPLTIDTNTSGMLVLSATNHSPWAIDLQRDDTTNSRVYNGGGFWNFEHGPRAMGNVIWHADNDGSGSGLDADTVDGIQASSFLRSDANDSYSGILTGGELAQGRHPYHNSYYGLWNTEAYSSDNQNYMIISGGTDTYINGNGSVYIRGDDNSSTNELRVTTSGSTIGGNTIWHAGNDGSGSGLDADLLDGVQGSSYLRSDAVDSLVPSGWTSPSTHAALNIGYNGGGQTRAIDIDGGWGGGESKAISFTHGSSSTNLVGQFEVRYDSPASRMRWGKLYHGGDSSTYTMELISQSQTTANLYVTGTVAATSFTGDGSNLTGISSGPIWVIGNTSGGISNDSGMSSGTYLGTGQVQWNFDNTLSTSSYGGSATCRSTNGNHFTSSVSMPRYGSSQSTSSCSMGMGECGGNGVTGRHEGNKADVKMVVHI